MHASHLRRLFSDKQPKFYASNSNKDKSNVVDQDRNQQCWDSAADLIYENLKQHSNFSREGNTNFDGEGICRILISTLRAVTGMVAMGGYATSLSPDTRDGAEIACGNQEPSHL